MYLRPGVFFFKNFFLAVFLFSCGQQKENPGPYAETRLCPGPESQPADNNDPLVLNAANQKLADEIVNPLMVAKTQILFGYPVQNINGIKKNLSAEIINGVLCLRLYSSNEKLAVRFLQDLLFTFEKEKNAKGQNEAKLKLSLLEEEMKHESAELQHLEDTFALFPEIKILDSATLLSYGQVKIRLGRKIENYTRLMRQKEDLQAEIKRQTFTLYRLQPPHYIKDQD